MGMEESYFIDTFQRVEKVFDDWGKATDSITVIPCYIDWKTRMVKDINGSDVISAAKIICSDQNIAYDDRIRIGGKDYSIIQINEKMAFNLQHMEILIQ